MPSNKPKENNMKILLTATLAIAFTATAFNIITPAEAQTPPVVFAATGANTTASASLTKVDLSNELYDDSGDFDATQDRFVAPEDGTYHFDGRVSFTFPGDGNHVSLYLYKNGVPVPEAIRQGFNNGGPNSVSLTVGSTLKLQAGDYIEIYGSRGTGTGPMGGSLNGHQIN
jgi:hypothetical protein